MIIPGYPCISFDELWKPPRPQTELPFPFGILNISREELSTFNIHEYYFARNGIYHAFQYFSIGAGDEVLMPELNSTIEVMVVRAVGATPIFYRIEPSTFTPDWNDVSNKISNRTRAFHLIHYMGVPNDLTTAVSFCQKNNLVFFEDAAYGYCSSYQKKPLGSFGDFSIMCPRKTVPMTNGGILAFGPKSTRSIKIDLPTTRISWKARYSSALNYDHITRSFAMKERPTTYNDLPHTHSFTVPLRKKIRRTLQRWYVSHGTAEFNLRYVDWSITPSATRLAARPHYQKIIPIIKSNARFVMAYCQKHGWDHFPREINSDVVPNAIVVFAQNRSHADAVSTSFIQLGIEISRPWQWHENINQWKNVQSVDAYVGRGLILPIHYQLNESHLTYYLNKLDRLLKS